MLVLESLKECGYSYGFVLQIGNGFMYSFDRVFDICLLKLSDLDRYIWLSKSVLDLVLVSCFEVGEISKRFLW